MRKAIIDMVIMVALVALLWNTPWPAFVGVMLLMVGYAENHKNA